MVMVGPNGDRRIRVIKGCQKAEGAWRHLKHGNAAIPEEVHNDDNRLNMYSQAFVWRSQTCGDPFREVLRMCLAFRSLPLEQKRFVFNYGLRRDKKVIRMLPPVKYAPERPIVEEESEEEEDEASQL